MEKLNTTKIKTIFLTFIFIVPFIHGLVKLFTPNNDIHHDTYYKVNLVNQIDGLSLSNQTVIEGKDYSGTIKLDKSVITDKVLPDSLDEIKSADKVVTDYTYQVNTDKLSADLKIPANSIKGDISIKITLVDKPIAEVHITLDPNGGTFVSGKPSIKLNLTNQKHLADFVDYEEPIPSDQEEYEFKYWTNGEDIITIGTVLDFAEDVTLKAYYDVKCVHTYQYQVIDKQLYSVCSKCGKTIRYTDEELKSFANKMLVMEDGGLALYDIGKLPYIVSRYMAADVYFIYGEYNLRGNRDGAQVEIKVHGLNNNEGEINATILNYMVGDDGKYYYVPLHGIKFTIDNVIMKSSFKYSDGFYFGLFSDSLICNNCRFIGKHSLYANYVEINNSTLDTTMITSDNLTDYAMYVYGSYTVFFNQCTFNSLGKAIKIYNEGYTPSDVTANNCVFNVIEPRLSNKAAIEIDSTYLVDKLFVVKIHQCTNNGHYQMWFDKSTHSDVTVD